MTHNMQSFSSSIMIRVSFEVSILPVILGITGEAFNSSLDSFRAMDIPHERALHLVQ